MGIKKTLASVVLAGAIALGLTGTGNADIIVSLNQPVEIYSSTWADPPKQRLPNSTQYLFEGYQIKTGVHIYDSLGILEDLGWDDDPRGVFTLFDGDIRSEARPTRISSDGLEADYPIVLTVESSYCVSGFGEVTIQAQGYSEVSNSVSLGNFYFNVNPEPSTLGLLALGGIGLLINRKRKR